MIYQVIFANHWVGDRNQSQKKEDEEQSFGRSDTNQTFASR